MIKKFMKCDMELKRPLSPDQDYEQVKNYYLVEKAIAERLKNADKEERKRIYATMYDELFSKIPYHSRFKKRANAKLTAKANKSKLTILRRFLDKSVVFAEFGPGDCKLASEVAKRTKFVYGIDISDQTDKYTKVLKNFKLIIYDGYKLEVIKKNSIDLVFRDQLIEHLHPEDKVRGKNTAFIQRPTQYIALLFG